MFKGSIVALITPFKNNKLDEDCYISLIHHHLKNGTSGLVPAGTTGESPTLSHKEHERVIELCVKESKGKIPVIAGTGSNSTDEAISLTKYAEKIGADEIFIFIDTDYDDSTGYMKNTVGAEQLIHVTGHYGIIKSCTISNYNPNPEFDYPLPAVIQRALEAQRKSEVDGTGIDTSDTNISQTHQTHKDVITDRVQDYYPDLKDTPEGEEQINEGNPPTSLEPNETSNIPITVGASGVPQQQYREYLGIPTKDKPTFVKPNLHKFYQKTRKLPS